MRFWVEVRRKKWVDVKQKARPAGDSRTEGRSQGMTYNLENALHGVQESRIAVMLESGDAETHEQMDALKKIELLLNQVEVLIKTYQE